VGGPGGEGGRGRGRRRASGRGQAPTRRIVHHHEGGVHGCSHCATPACAGLQHRLQALRVKLLHQLLRCRARRGGDDRSRGYMSPRWSRAPAAGHQPAATHTSDSTDVRTACSDTHLGHSRRQRHLPRAGRQRIDHHERNSVSSTPPGDDVGAAAALLQPKNCQTRRRARGRPDGTRQIAFHVCSAEGRC